MSLDEPTVRLDPRHYQDLVDEARNRVGERCHEWTDHNVSDPGMTLIDQFAWMTDILLYRVNRLPESIHEALLDLLGVQLEAPVAARTKLRFRLAQAPTNQAVEISSADSNQARQSGGKPQPAVEVASLPDEGRPGVVFQVSENATVPILELAAAAIWRAERPPGHELVAVRVVDGAATPGPDALDRHAFSTPPRSDDALYLGFDDPIANLVLQLHVQAVPARGTNIDPDLVPWTWEVPRADGAWEPAEGGDPVEVLSETTGGFNYADGTVELQIPEESAATLIGGVRKYWLRCRPTKTGSDAGGSQAFENPPQILRIKANAIGVLARAHHAVLVEAEELGVSDGTAGQTFRVLHAPTLALADGETVEVERRKVDRGTDSGGDDDWMAWQYVESFYESGHDDRHFLFDPATGEVKFGIAIKLRGYDPNSVEVTGWHHHGAIPPPGVRVRLSRYRHGGGAAGNIEANALTLLRTPIPGVASVTNPKPARGGLEGETLDGAHHRAADQLRIRRRAVTREDFEFVAVNASPEVHRARCIAPEPDVRRFPRHPRPIDERTTANPSRADRRDPWPLPAVRVCVLPHIHDPRVYNPREELRATRALRRVVRDRLEEWCLVGTSAHVTPVALREVTVAVEVEVARTASPPALERRVVRALHRYLSPYIGGSLTGDGKGWEWGRALEVRDVRALLERIDGVLELAMLRVYETGLAPTADDPHRYRPIDERLVLGPHELLMSGRHEARASHPGAR